MRLPSGRLAPEAPPPPRNLLASVEERMALCPLPRPRVRDYLIWVVLAIYAGLALTLIFGGTSPRVACAVIGHVLELGCAGR